jgi:hypothetical protein
VTADAQDSQTVNFDVRTLSASTSYLVLIAAKLVIFSLKHLNMSAVAW